MLYERPKLTVGFWDYLQESEEVPAVGIFSLRIGDRKDGDTCSCMQMTLFPWRSSGLARIHPVSEGEKSCWKPRLRECAPILSESSLLLDIGDFEIHSCIPKINRDTAEMPTDVCLGTLEPIDFLQTLLTKDSVLEKLSSQLIDVLQRSVQVRVSNISRTSSESRTNEKTSEDLYSCRSKGYVQSDDGANGFCENFQIQEDKQVHDLHDNLTNTEHESKFGANRSQALNTNSSQMTVKCEHQKANVAILFSGGIDSTIIAALADR